MLKPRCLRCIQMSQSSARRRGRGSGGKGWKGRVEDQRGRGKAGRGRGSSRGPGRTEDGQDMGSDNDLEVSFFVFLFIFLFLSFFPSCDFPFEDYLVCWVGFLSYFCYFLLLIPVFILSFSFSFFFFLFLILCLLRLFSFPFMKVRFCCVFAGYCLSSLFLDYIPFCFCFFSIHPYIYLSVPSLTAFKFRFTQKKGLHCLTIIFILTLLLLFSLSHFLHYKKKTSRVQQTGVCVTLVVETMLVYLHRETRQT